MSSATWASIVAVVCGTVAVVKMIATPTKPVARVPTRWFATHPGKRWTEFYFLAYAPVWIGLMAIIVASGAYENFEGGSYMAVGVATSFPCFFGPLLFPGQGEPNLPILERFWVKANLWIWILSFIGNYLWTHYFYSLLGASYTFKAWRLNDVPFALFLVTQAYFTFYHSLTNIILRRFWTSSLYQSVSPSFRWLPSVVFVFVLAIVTAFMETFTISGFPYYTFKNKAYMYSVGSCCYGIYFIVTFPMFYRILESPRETSRDWPLSRVAIDSLGACMAVTMLLDFWRLAVGGVDDSSLGWVPWLSVQ